MLSFLFENAIEKFLASYLFMFDGMCYRDEQVITVQNFTACIHCGSEKKLAFESLKLWVQSKVLMTSMTAGSRCCTSSVYVVLEF